MRASLGRRAFLRELARASAGAVAAPALRPLAPAAGWIPPPPAPLREQPPLLRRRFPRLERHFIFEYYPWYGGPPDYEHWDYLDREPPLDLSTRYLPRLGAYDVRSLSVLEQHARWIREAGIGAVSLSWWGRESWPDRAAPLILDVLREHDLKATFGLEPYAADRGSRFAEDVLFLLREYGERRRWDVFLLLPDAFGRIGPVFKGFACILPETSTDCLGETRPLALHTPDAVWRQQTDAVRDSLRHDFDRVTLLADSLEFARTPASGFDGIGIYDNLIPPEDYAGYAAEASAAGLLFSFNVNPGYDQIEPRMTDDPCYAPRPFAPLIAGLDWSREEAAERAARASEERIRASWTETLRLQRDPALENDRRGFLLVYVNSFNEWHEGHAFEPMKDRAELTPAERALGYRNPARGDYRLQALAAVQRELLEEEGGEDSPFDRPREVPSGAV